MAKRERVRAGLIPPAIPLSECRDRGNSGLPLTQASDRKPLPKLSRRRLLLAAAAAAPALMGYGCDAPVSDDKAQARNADTEPANAAPSKPKPAKADARASVQVWGDGEDWPNLLGPRHNGTSLETGLLKAWPPEGPPVVWSRPVGESFSAPVISRRRLVHFDRVGNYETVECFDALDESNVYWKYRYPTNYVDRYRFNGGPRSSPAIDGERVYTFGAEGVLTCLEFETGRLVWQRQANEDFGVSQGFFGVATSPLIEGDLLLLNVGGWGGAGVVAFDKNSGATVWKTSNDGASYSSPVVATIHGERLAIFHTAAGLLVLEAQTGAERYQYPFRSKVYQSAIAASPVVVDDVVFLSATYGIGAIALKLDPGGLKKVWKDRRAMQNHWATSIYHEGYLYGMDGRHEQGSNFRCIEFETGRVVWTAEEGLGRASFIMAEGHLIAIGERGDLALIEVSPEGYKEKARSHVLSHPVWTPPVLSHGRLYIRNETEMRCLDLRVRT